MFTVHEQLHKTTNPNQQRKSRQQAAAIRRFGNRKQEGGNFITPAPRRSQAGVKRGPVRPGAFMQRSAAPVSMSTRIRSTAPLIDRMKNGNLRVKHRELVIASITGTSSFTVANTLVVNPGLAATFPWLSQQAILFEQYACHALKFIYIPVAPTSTQGDIMLTPYYDVSKPTPTTETQASDCVGSVEDSCWRDIICQWDVKAAMGLGPRRYVRSTNVAGDQKTYDIGKQFVITNNSSGTPIYGKLWVEYDFEFFTPQNDPSSGTTPAITSYYAGIPATTFSNITAAPMGWGTAAIYDPLGFGAPSSGVFTPAAGVYRLSAVLTFLDSSSEQFTAQVQVWKNGASYQVNSIGVSATVESPAGSANERVQVILETVMPMNGTDTCQYQVTLTGAAGSLSAPTGQSHLLVSLA